MFRSTIKVGAVAALVVAVGVAALIARGSLTEGPSPQHASAAGAGAALSGLPSAQAQPAAGIEGSWLVRLPDLGNEHQLASFLPGGVMLATNTPVEPDEEGGGREYATPGHGAWTSLGEGRYAFTFTNLGFDDDGTFVSMSTIDATVTIDATGDRFSGSLTHRRMLPSGQEVFTSPPLAIEATRIRPPAP